MAYLSSSVWGVRMKNGMTLQTITTAPISQYEWCQESKSNKKKTGFRCLSQNDPQTFVH